ncbi:hypothetical protein [Paenibacillus methanolicus]|uniref:Alpha-L-rhamnosidase-like protein n=1 Tax=Paenibacillus methanolicus TaxID=582686 RepID=A0A5S5CJF1_9BACL|nr:hypothetical protein [Paenibacillus methanolicus]TYP79143.1 hypothetical protein BCM02_101259 [Paenibacillus methanolicus]
MNKELTFLSFWAINGGLDATNLNSRLDAIRASGFDGVVFHPRRYPNQPPYLSSAYFDGVSEIILHARSIGLRFWIYDENGWPSGIAGGEVLRQLPGSRCEWIEWREADGQGKIAFGSKQAVNSLDEAATALFIRLTYDGYRLGLHPEAFAHVEGFFSDEVAFLDGHGLTLKTGAVPWDLRLPERYLARYGERLEPQLPLLFTAGEGDGRLRSRYWELMSDLLAESFYRPVADWCAAHGKRFTAHLKAEEHPYFQLSYSGSCLELLRQVETPAIDALERYPGNDYYPMLARSVAMQQGRGGALAEAMGGGGWGVNPETFETYALWLAGHGIDTFVVHLQQDRLDTQAIQDWPPSMPAHMTWREAFPSLLRSIQAKAARMPDLSDDPELLIVMPTRGVMAGFEPREAAGMNEHDGSRAPDTKAAAISLAAVRLVEAVHRAGIHAELSEERTVERDGRLSEGMLRIGHRAYRRVLLADGCAWSDEGLPDRLRRAGVQVMGPDEWQSLSAKRGESASSRSAPFAAAMVIPPQSEWTISKLPSPNRLPIEWRQLKDGRIGAELVVDRIGELPGRLEVFLHDRVESLQANGRRITLKPSGDGYVADLGAGADFEAAASDLILRLEAAPLPLGEPIPAAFVQGGFEVCSRSEWTDKDGRQLMTAGPLVLAPIDCHSGQKDMIRGGYPFCGDPVTIAKTIELPPGAPGRLRLAGLRADAAFVRIGDRTGQWCWGPEWIIELAEDATGVTEVEAVLYPSTYNRFGPHRHVDGDRHLVSPDQFKGVRNFADHPDAPASTLGAHWHAVKWEWDGQIELLAHDDQFQAKAGS